MRTTRTTRATRTVATALFLLPLAACGSDGGSESDGGVALSDTEHNDADVSFATDMIPHHAQALTLVDLTAGRDLDPEVVALADEIRAAQAPEIETMAAWLTDWDEELPATARDHSHAGHGGEQPSEVTREMEQEGTAADMAGMLSADQLEALEEADDAAFESMWLDAMVAHHRGAIAMAEAEQEDGRYRPAVELAGDVVETQTAEIEQIRALQG